MSNGDDGLPEVNNTVSKAEPTYWQKYYREHRERRIAESRQYQRKHAEERSAYLSSYYETNKEKILEQSRQYREQTKDERNAKRRRKYAESDEVRSAAKLAARTWSRNNPDKALAQDIRQFGINLTEYRALLEKQNGKCAICGKASADSRNHRLHIDHDHATGKVRGLLCAACNLGIGKFSESAELIERALQYLRESRNQ